MKSKILLVSIIAAMLYTSCKLPDHLTTQYEVITLPGSMFDIDVKE